MNASTITPTLKPSASTSAYTPTSVNNWDPLELWLDLVCLDSCDSNEQLHMNDRCNINMDDSAVSPSTPTIAYFQSKATLEDFATFDFGDSLFVSDLDTMTTTSSLPSLNDSFFAQALEKSADLLSMKVSSSSSAIAPVESTNASGTQSSPPRTLKRPAKSPSTNNLKKPRLCALNNSSTAKATKNIKATTTELKLQVRKVKQRGYERTYRGRLRTKRAEDEALWMTLEAQLRAILGQKSAVCAPESYTLLQPSSSSGSLALECIDMAHHLRALQEEKALWTALDKWIGALNMWGGETEASRSIRYQINALQKLPYSPAFVNFTW